MRILPQLINNVQGRQLIQHIESTTKFSSSSKTWPVSYNSLQIRKNISPKPIQNLCFNSMLLYGTFQLQICFPGYLENKKGPQGNSYTIIFTRKKIPPFPETEILKSPDEQIKCYFLQRNLACQSFVHLSRPSITYISYSTSVCILLNLKIQVSHSFKINQQRQFDSYQTAKTRIHYPYQFRQGEVFNFNGTILKRRGNMTYKQKFSKFMYSSILQMLYQIHAFWRSKIKYLEIAILRALYLTI